MTQRQSDVGVVGSKLVPPGLPNGMIVRQRLVDRLSKPARFTLVDAVGGYGKTVAVRHWHDTVSVPTAWLTLDLLDADAGAFWIHLIEALRSTNPMIDDEPATLLGERGADDTVFLRSLVTQIEQRAVTTALVLDGLHDRLERSVLDGINVLVERVGHLTSIVATARSSPQLPLARWRSVGWLNEVRDAELRFTDDEAVEVAHQSTVRHDDAEIVRYNQRIEGWPIGMQMAVTTGHPDLLVGDTGGAPGPLTPTSDPLLADYVLDELFDAVPDEERNAALSLSILEWFDPEMAEWLLGADAAGLIGSLVARRLPITVVDQRTGVVRLQPLLRELLEHRLSRCDPARRVDLHRRAATLWRARGDLAAAHRHLVAIDAIDEFHDFLAAPALDMIDQGDIEGLRRLAHRLPEPRDVLDPEFAADLAIISLHASGTGAAREWADRVERLSGSTGVLRRRIVEVRCAIALLDADLDAALAGMTRPRRGEGTSGGSRIERRFPIIAARTALAARDPAALGWIREAERIDGPDIVRSVTVPTLRAWYDWIHGRLDSAAARSGRAVGWMDAHHIGPHHLAFDALITAGWCRLSMGDVGPATDLAERATHDAEILDCAWTSLQAGFLAARLSVTAGDHATALRTVEDLRSTIDLDRCRSYSDRIVAVEIEGLAGIGRLDEIDRRLAGFSPSPRTNVLIARFGRLTTDGIAAALADHETWPAVERMQARLLLLAGADAPSATDVAALLAEAALTGWVLPFIGLGHDVDALMFRSGVERLHPRLAHALAHRAGTPSGDLAVRTAPAIGHLTARELTLLELLPTHLSYKEMGTRLFLSVNTVKTNLQSLYRKLDASTRAEAVEAGERAGYL